MKGLALVLIVGGWVMAVGGLVATEAMMVRTGAALAGLAFSLAGIGALNNAHVANAFWKGKAR